VSKESKWLKMEVRDVEVVFHTIRNSPVVLDLQSSYVAIIRFVVRRNSCPSSEVRQTL